MKFGILHWLFLAAVTPLRICGVANKISLRTSNSKIPGVFCSCYVCFWLTAVAAQSGLCQTWSEAPQTGFLMVKMLNTIVLFLHSENGIWDNFVVLNYFHLNLIFS